jgi:SagB-type dehydrogenase family enzyme
MLNTLWKTTALDTDPGEMAWEQFHESSKTGRYDLALTNEQVLAEMDNLYTSLPYRNFTPIPLPDTLAPMPRGFADIMRARVTPRACTPVPLTLEQLRTVLYCAYGETRDNIGNPYVHRPFRTVPSGGGLYPLELYFYQRGDVAGLDAGIYHYSPALNALHFVKPGNFDEQLAHALVEFQSGLARDLSVVVFITALFQRSVFKYRNKGYRFCLLEAGHVAQNLNLSATALGLGVINIGGFFDRRIDDLLGLDGIHHSVLYLNGLCAGGSHGDIA